MVCGATRAVATLTDLAERLGVCERAGGGPVRRQRSDLEVLAPRGVRRGDAVLGGWPEPEARVVRRAAEQRDQRLTERVSGAEDGVHHCGADAASLLVGTYGDRPESERTLSVDVRAGAHDVADHLAASRLGDQRERGEPALVGAELVEQHDLDRLLAGILGAGERRPDHFADRLVISGPLATHEHGTGATPGRCVRGQRVSRCTVCRPQFGQNFFSSRRSGSLRRFFRVM